MAALVVIGGSTASGKSALGLRVAAAVDGIVVNADSQQLFRDLPILTARPSAADERLVPHRLYGILGPDEAPSVGRWLVAMADVLDGARGSGRPLVLVGGSGLYLEALLHGIAVVPPVPGSLRRDLRQEGAMRPAAELHRKLATLDPVMAGRLRPTDRQRILRALEVIVGTGRSLAYWQAQEPHRLDPPGPVLGVALLPPAMSVNERVERRVAAMLADGALGEVRELSACRPDLAALPIAKVLGARILLSRLAGRLDLTEAAAALTIQVRQYAKRQRTFFRGRLGELRPLTGTGDDPALAGELIEFCRRAR